MNKKIGVFLSGSYVAEEYTQHTKEFGKLIADNGYDLVWGGSNVGLMKVIADSVEDSNGKLYGVCVTDFYEIAREGAEEMLLPHTICERKQLLLEKSDALVVIMGGIGTLDEITDVLESKKRKAHNKPVVVINTNGYYNGFRDQLNTMYDNGALGVQPKELIFFADTPDEAIEYLNKEL